MLASVVWALFLSLSSTAYGENVQQYFRFENVTRVPVTLGVMSRCPDALLCEATLDKTFQKTWDLISLDLTFIAKENTSDVDYGVTCMHGVEECAGNIQELCAIRLSQDQQQWWTFVQCLNFEGRSKIGNVDLAQKCAGVAKIRWDDEEEEVGMQTCINGDTGKEFLIESLTQSQELGITTSCSIIITGKVRCIHDGDWKSCETGHTPQEFEEFIRKEYNRLNP